jgi:hypothetical protein
MRFSERVTTCMCWCSWKSCISAWQLSWSLKRSYLISGCGNGAGYTVFQSIIWLSTDAFWEQKRKKSTHILQRGGKQQKLGLHRENSPSSADFYHLQLPQM